MAATWPKGFEILALKTMRKKIFVSNRAICLVRLDHYMSILISKVHCKIISTEDEDMWYAR